MSIFKYKAVSKDGKAISGLVEAPSEKIASDILKEKELEIISLVEKKGGLSKISFTINRIKARDIVIFSRQFSVLISANVALVQALRLLITQTPNPKLKAIIGEVADEVDGGARLSDALAAWPEVFSGFYVNVIRSGETSGKLDEVLNYLADELEKDYDMISKIRGAMIYPAFVFFGLGGVGVLMMVVVVPKLTDIMEETGGQLPLATRILIATSHFLRDYWWLILIFLIGLAASIKFIVRLPVGKRIVDIIILKIPIFGKLFQRIYLVRFTRSLQTLLTGGVNISKALAITSEVVSNQVYRDLILKTKKEVEDGSSITSVFATSKEIPKMVTQMMSIGEKTGRLSSILGSISKFFSREIDNVMTNLMTLMEPIIMVVMGVAVGIMVAAVIMPMYNMASQF
jgi:type IV pilus assembly protein PilC